MRCQDGAAELELRVSELDAGAPVSGALPVSVTDAMRLIVVLEESIGTGEYQEASAVSPDEADSIISRSSLMARLGRAEPALVTGSAAGSPQYWVSTSKPPWLPPGDPVPSAGRFVAPPEGVTSPFGYGFYTSSGFGGTQGMWRLYLDLNDYSNSFPLPWRVWRVTTDPGARVGEVASAADWADLVLRYPLTSEGVIYPDWRAMAAEWDAVHITARAVAAIHGLRLRVSDKLIAPSHWSVETTFWLRWKVTSAELRERVGSPASRP